MHSPIKRNVLQLKKLNNSNNKQPGLVAFYGVRPGNAAGLFSEEKMSKGGAQISKKSEGKRIIINSVI